MRKETQSRQIKNYFKCANAGILFLLTAALVSGCGSLAVDDGEASGQKKVLSQAEIQELTDLLAVDAAEDGWDDEDDDDDEERVPGIIEEDGDSNSHYTYIWGWKDDGDWDDEDDDDEDVMILAQCTDDGKILQTFSREEIELYSGETDEATELLGVTDHEIICSANLYMKDDSYIWYRIPLSYENGSEKVLCDKKEIIYRDEEGEAGLENAAGKYLLCGGVRDLFVLDRESGKKLEIIKKDETYGYCGDADPWIDPEGNLHAVLTKHRDAIPYALYAYQTQTQEIQEITDEITSESRIASGDGKIFYTGLVNAQMRNDYNLYVYDMENGQKKVLASEAEIRDMLLGEPADNADLIREVVYAQGMLYLEIRYADECYVLSCTPDQGELTRLEGMPGLAKHTEYHFPKPIENGDDQYCNVNDHNIFKYEAAEGGVVERTLEGAYVRTIHLVDYPYALLYVSNQELICQYMPDPCGSPVFCSIPLTYMDGNDYPEVSRKTEIVRDSNWSSELYQGRIYANERYLIYLSSLRDFKVYDRQEKCFIDIAGLPEEGETFAGRSILKYLSGDSISLMSVDMTKEGHGYQFSLYHFGDSKAIGIDPSAYVNGCVGWCRDGKRFIYGRFSEDEEDVLEYCSYDIQTGTREVLFTEKDLQKLLKKGESGHVEIELAADTLYIFVDYYKGVDRCQVCSYDLAGEGELRYEAQISDFFMNRADSYGEYELLEGKVLFKAWKEDDEDIVANSEKYYYYDLETGKSAEFDKGDPEWLYWILS